MGTGRRLTRRGFLRAAAATAAGTAGGTTLWRAPRTPSTRTPGGGGTGTFAPREATTGAGAPELAQQSSYFFSAEEEATAAAICSRVVPSVDPVTGAPAPGATQAMAVVYIDRLLAAFDLPHAVADNPAIYLRGPYSGRNPYSDDDTGEPSSTYPPDSFLSADGQAHFLPLSPLQTFSWRALLEGPAQAGSDAPPFVSRAWIRQNSGGSSSDSAPPAGGLRSVYREGLAAFDTYSKSAFGVPFAGATSDQQDLMLEAAGNVVVSQVPAPSPPGAPQAAKQLFPYIVLHTFQGSYGLPEYRWSDGPAATVMWKEIGWDGDTQPLGNSVYDENLFGPGEGPNAGFGDPAVYVPRGGYREHRPVSYLGSGDSTLTESDVAPLAHALEARGFVTRGAPSSAGPTGATGAAPAAPVVTATPRTP